MLKCDKLLSFNESTHTVPVVDPNSLDLLCMNFRVRKDDLFPRNICQAQVFSVVCVCVQMY